MNINKLMNINCKRSELSNPGSILMMCVVRTYVSVMLRNVTVTSRRNVASMRWVRSASIFLMTNFAGKMV